MCLEIHSATPTPKAVNRLKTQTAKCDLESFDHFNSKTVQEQKACAKL